MNDGTNISKENPGTNSTWSLPPETIKETMNVMLEQVGNFLTEYASTLKEFAEKGFTSINVADAINNTVLDIKQGIAEGKPASEIAQKASENLAKFGIGSAAYVAAYDLMNLAATGALAISSNLFLPLAVSALSVSIMSNMLKSISDLGFMYFGPNTNPNLVPLRDVQDHSNQFSGAKGIRRDPISVDLDNDGIETTDTTTGVYFDLDGNGTKEKTSWVKGDDGFIVMDRNGNGTIDSGKELFGDATEIKAADGTTKIAATGFEALAAEDTNADKIIDASDENFSKLKVWQDKNQDGISQTDELKSLTDAGISKIHLDYLTVNTTDAQGNIQTRSSGFEFTDGRTGSTGEFLFDRNTIDTSNPDFSNVPPEMGFLPYLRGFGNVTDLYHAMAFACLMKFHNKVTK